MGKNQSVSTYTAEAILNLTSRDIMMDVQGGLRYTTEASSDKVYSVVKMLEKEYKESSLDSWSFEYEEEEFGFFVSMEKEYRSRNKESLDVEIRGFIDIDLYNFPDIE